MKNLIKSRRGIAIEMAIGAMFIMIALSIVLISISGMQTRHMKNDLDEFDKKVEVYEITDLIMKGSIENGTVTTSSGNVYTIGTNENTYTVTKDGNQILIFTVENKTITSWRD